MANIKQFVKEQKKKEWWLGTRSALSRVPVASLIAWVMCVGAIVTFCVCLNGALDYLIAQLQLPIIRLGIWLLMILHIVVATYFLIVATLSTGDTRKEVCTERWCCNMIGRGCQICCICIAYFFHFLWLFLPCVLLFPVILLTVFTVLCTLVPNCINVRDYGIDPKMLDKYSPERIVTMIQNFDESMIEKFAAQAETAIIGYLDKAEDSGAIDKIFDKIENHIPSDDQLDGAVDQVADQIENIDLTQVEEAIDNINVGEERVDEEMEELEEQSRNMTQNTNRTLEDRRNVTQVDDGEENAQNRNRRETDETTDDEEDELEEEDLIAEADDVAHAQEEANNATRNAEELAQRAVEADDAAATARTARDEAEQRAEVSAEELHLAEETYRRDRSNDSRQLLEEARRVNAAAETQAEEAKWAAEDADEAAEEMHENAREAARTADEKATRAHRMAQQRAYDLQQQIVEQKERMLEADEAAQIAAKEVDTVGEEEVAMLAEQAELTRRNSEKRIAALQSQQTDAERLIQSTYSQLQNTTTVTDVIHTYSSGKTAEKARIYKDRADRLVSKAQESAEMLNDVESRTNELFIDAENKAAAADELERELESLDVNSDAYQATKRRYLEARESAESAHQLAIEAESRREGLRAKVIHMQRQADDAIFDAKSKANLAKLEAAALMEDSDIRAERLQEITDISERKREMINRYIQDLEGEVDDELLTLANKTEAKTKHLLSQAQNMTQKADGTARQLQTSISEIQDDMMAKAELLSMDSENIATMFQNNTDFFARYSNATSIKANLAQEKAERLAGEAERYMQSLGEAQERLENATRKYEELGDQVSLEAMEEAKRMRAQIQELATATQVKAHEAQEMASRLQEQAVDVQNKADAAARQAQDMALDAKHRAQEIKNVLEQKARDAEQKVALAQQRAQEAQEWAQSSGSEVAHQAQMMAEQAQAEAERYAQQAQERLAQAQATVQNIQAMADSAQSRADEIAAQAESMATAVQSKAEAASRKAQEMVQSAEQVKVRAEQYASEMRERAAEYQRLARETGDEAMQRAYEVANEAKLHAEQIAREAQERVQQLQQMAQQAQGQAEELMHRAQNMGEEAVRRGQEMAQKLQGSISQIVQDAQQIAESAQRAAEIAVQEAQLAVQRAQQAARDVANAAEGAARDAAIKAQQVANEVARKAKESASKALKKAQQASAQAAQVLRSLAKGATDFAKKAAKKARKFAKLAIKGARKAAKQARKYAKEAVKFVRAAKKQSKKVYAVYLKIVEKMRIKRINKATYCSETKRIYCREAMKSHLYMIIVYIMSIILNLSFVHFLMAQAANYVHLTRETESQRQQDELRMEQIMSATSRPVYYDSKDQMMVDAPNEKEQLVFRQMDSGSMDLVDA